MFGYSSEDYQHLAHHHHGTPGSEATGGVLAASASGAASPMGGARRAGSVSPMRHTPAGSQADEVPSPMTLHAAHPHSTLGYRAKRRGEHDLNPAQQRAFQFRGAINKGTSESHCAGQGWRGGMAQGLGMGPWCWGLGKGCKAAATGPGCAGA